MTYKILEYELQSLILTCDVVESEDAMIRSKGSGLQLALVACTLAVIPAGDKSISSRAGLLWVDMVSSSVNCGNRIWANQAFEAGSAE